MRNIIIFLTDKDIQELNNGSIIEREDDVTIVRIAKANTIKDAHALVQLYLNDELTKKGICSLNN